MFSYISATNLYKQSIWSSDCKSLVLKNVEVFFLFEYELNMFCCEIFECALSKKVIKSPLFATLDAVLMF